MTKSLNLLFIDGNQLYAERIVELLSHYYNKVNLGFLDDSVELEKILRRKWDVAIYGRAYDIELADLKESIQKRNLDLPIIALLTGKNNTTDLNEEGLPTTISSHLIRSIHPNNEREIVSAIILQYENVQSRKEVLKLRNIIDEAEQRANVLIKNSKSAVAYIDQGIHVFANEPYQEMFGFSDITELMGLPVIDLIASGDSVKEFKQFLRRFDKGNRDNVEFEFESKRPDGSTFEAKLQVAMATYDGQPVTQIIIQHNQSGVNAEEIAAKLAEVERKDSLTGLDNRKGLQTVMDSMFNVAKSGQSVLGLMYIRIDNLAEINTLIGIDAVDLTVKHVAHKIEEILNGSYICRFSDSVYLAVVKKTDQNKLTELSKQVIKDVDEMIIEVDKRSVTTSVSIGAAILDAQSPSFDVIVKRAGEAHTKAVEKSADGGGLHVYDPSELAGKDSAVLAEYLAGAVKNEKLRLSYQPIYDIETDSSDTFEVDLLLALSDGEKMKYAEFLDVANQHNLSATFDRWMLVNACKELSSVKAQHPNASIIVKLSSASLIDEQLPAVMQKLIGALGGDSSALTLQFRESSIVDYLTVAQKQFAQLKQLNTRISISSFGSTEKALELLPMMQPSMVKVDRSYISDLSSEENVNTLKELIVNASNHSVSALMPYIEDAAKMSVSWGVGARYLQGDYLQAPDEHMTFGE